jgi:hypothetical protein
MVAVDSRNPAAGAPEPAGVHLAELSEIGSILREQATRIAELEDELAHARVAADGARALAYRESLRRVEIDEELHAIHQTKLWRYSAEPRRVYRQVRSRFVARNGRDSSPRAAG